MNVNPSIFRAYDIRGKYPTEITEDAAFKIGHAFVAFLRKNTKKKKLRVGIGRDTRLSSPRLFSAFSKALRGQGFEVVDLGIISTPMLYFAVFLYGFQGGAMITASHNPNPYNGIKLTREKAIPLGRDTGLQWMRKYIERQTSFEQGKFKGKLTKKNITKEYVSWNLKQARVKKGAFKGFCVVLDAGNGVGGAVTLALLKEVGVKVYPLYLKPDGRFPNHIPDPSHKENVQALLKLVKRKKAHFGIALDGDADRILFADEKGTILRGDLMTAFFASLLAKKGDKIVYDLGSSNVVRDVVREAGAHFIMSKVGYPSIKEHMRRGKAVFAGEYSRHYYLGKGFFFEAPLFVLLVLLLELKRTKLPLSVLMKPFLRYAYSGEINVPATNKQKRIEEFKRRYRRGKKTTIDGLRVDFPDWWFLLRPSNTEPVLRLIIEATTKKLLSVKRRELIGFLKG